MSLLQKVEFGSGVQYIDPLCMASNNKVIQFARNMMSIASGCAAGILGLTGIQGFILYTILFVMTSLGLAAKMDFKVEKYVPNTTLSGFVFSGIAGEVLPFVLYWTLFYALVHIY